MHNQTSGLTAAIVVLVCCTGAARATVEQKNGTNAIAFSEERGDRSANLVLSTLDLAMMDPAERDNMLASLETHYGKPKIWASRAARSTSKSVFAFARDGEKEKYGVRLRARELPPVFNSEVSNTVPADNARASEQIASASLLGVSRSEVLTWKPNQDSYLGHFLAIDFVYDHDSKWINTGLNKKLEFGDGHFSPTWNGFSLKQKVQADLAGRLEYNQWWYKPKRASGKFVDLTRDMTAGASVGGRVTLSGIFSWGHDWSLPGFSGHYGLGAEASLAIGLWPNLATSMDSTNTKPIEDTLSVNFTVGPYVELQGNFWIGKTEHKEADDDTVNPESHKLVNGVKAAIVFTGYAGGGFGYKCTDLDWYNDKHNNEMHHDATVGNTKANGKLVARGEIKFWAYTIQNGYLIWQGETTNPGHAVNVSRSRAIGLDQLL